MPTEEGRPRISPEGQPPYPWIVQPVVDLLFVCGGLPLLLIGVNVATIGWRVPFDGNTIVQRSLLILILFGQHLFADAHNAATHLRIWGSGEDRDRFAFYRIWLTLTCLPLFLLGLVSPRATSVFVYLYLITVFWHYAAQAFGISLIYLAKRGYLLSVRERFIYKYFFVSLSAMTIVRFVTFRALSAEVWFGIPIPFWGPLPHVLYQAVASGFALFATLLCMIVVRKAAFDRMLLPLPSALIIATTAWLGISLGPANSLLWLYVPAFFHGFLTTLWVRAYLFADGLTRRVITIARGIAEHGKASVGMKRSYFKPQ